MARRLFLLAGVAELVAAGDGSGGLDIALGPTLGSSPLGALGPSMILPGLVAGPSTLDPRLTPAALPLVSPLLVSLLCCFLVRYRAPLIRKCFNVCQNRTMSWDMECHDNSRSQAKVQINKYLNRQIPCLFSV